MLRPALALLLLVACTDTVTAPGYCDACREEWAPECAEECEIQAPHDAGGDGDAAPGDGDGDGDSGMDAGGDGDTGDGDAGLDGGGDGDAGCIAHLECVPGGVCHMATGLCVECLSPSDRGCPLSTPRCLSLPGDSPTDSACVECLEHDDCTDPAASRCDARACAGCAEDAHCAHLPDTLVCSAGECVECTVDDESACGGNSCDPATRACTTTPIGSLGTCRACLADSECSGDGARCVPLAYQSAPQGGFCLNDAGGGCARPYSVAVEAESLSGAAEATYCGIDQEATTCQALLDLVDGVECAGGMDSECSEAGLCRTVGVLADQCTYACGIAAQCPAGLSCPNGHCE